jgi:hypothetical protein
LTSSDSVAHNFALIRNLILYCRTAAMQLLIPGPDHAP